MAVVGQDFCSISHQCSQCTNMHISRYDVNVNKFAYCQIQIANFKKIAIMSRTSCRIIAVGHFAWRPLLGQISWCWWGLVSLEDRSPEYGIIALYINYAMGWVMEWYDQLLNALRLKEYGIKSVLHFLEIELWRFIQISQRFVLNGRLETKQVWVQAWGRTVSRNDIVQCQRVCTAMVIWR